LIKAPLHLDAVLRSFGAVWRSLAQFGAVRLNLTRQFFLQKPQVAGCKRNAAVVENSGALD